MKTMAGGKAVSTAKSNWVELLGITVQELKDNVGIEGPVARH